MNQMNTVSTRIDFDQEMCVSDDECEEEIVNEEM